MNEEIQQLGLTPTQATRIAELERRVEALELCIGRLCAKCGVTPNPDLAPASGPQREQGIPYHARNCSCPLCEQKRVDDKRAWEASELGKAMSQPPPREADAGQEAEWPDIIGGGGQPPPPAPAATERQEQAPITVRSEGHDETWTAFCKWKGPRQPSAFEAFAAGRESAQPQPAPDLGAAFEQWWENEGSKMPEWPPKPHAKQIFKAGAACRVSALPKWEA